MKQVRTTGTVTGSGLHAASRTQLRLGIDVGSTSSDVIVLDSKDHVVTADYRRTLGRPMEVVADQMQRLFEQYPAASFASIAITGSAGRLLAEVMQAAYVNEVQAQARGIAHLYPEYEQVTVIEMGGQDSKLIFLQRRGDDLELKNFSLNSACAAGTGSFLDQQAQRLGISIEEEFGRLALQSRSVPRMAGRCSVFAKSDMIHLQQVATPIEDILAGLCMALACSLRSGLGSGLEFVKPIIFTGGVAANAGVVRAFEDVLSLQQGELIVPLLHFYTGALGAICSLGETHLHAGAVSQAHCRLRSHLDSKRCGSEHLARRTPLTVPALPAPLSLVHDDLLSGEHPVDAYLGVDVGSISTNVVLIDKEHRVLVKEYLMTAGRPIEAVQQGLRAVGQKTCGKVRVIGAATTGSGRYLTGDFIGADIVINEITAQAAGTVSICPDVDTIFEIGGQDSKYIRLENGVVVDFEMNHACAAGTGSFLEEQAQRLGISIKNEFAELAMRSKRPLHLGERCTVFIESDLLGCQQQGASTEDLVAGLAYSIATNYLNRVVGRRKTGNHICFQGGTAFNKAVWAAFESVTGKPIRVPDHHEMTGAIGAAIIAAEHVTRLRNDGQPNYRCRFKGFENLTHAKYTVETFACEECPNHCEIKRVQIDGSEPLCYGSRCDRYNVHTSKKPSSRPDLLAWRTQKLFECANLRQNEKPSSGRPIVATPQALIAWHLLPMFSRFFQELGFDVLLSGRTDRTIIKRGIESVPSSPCFPVKAAFGHVRKLLDQQPDYLFVPFVVNLPPLSALNRHSKLCPYVQSFANQVGTAFNEHMGRTKLVTEPLHLGRGQKALAASFRALAAQFDIRDRRLVAGAIRAAQAAQADFEQQIAGRGREILASLKPGEKLFVLVSRPYNGLDEGMNLRLSHKLDDMNVRWIPMEMLDLAAADLAAADLTDPDLHRKVYWNYGQKILRAAEIIRRDKRLFAIYLSNFSCGPDSFLQHFFDEIMRPKPALILEVDEHSADAGLVTRLEAFFESLRHYRSSPALDARPAAHVRPVLAADQKMYIPYMSEASHGLAACFRAYGQPAQVMPMADESILNRGRRVTTGKECLPCAVTAGEMLSVLENDPAGKCAFLMPDGDGPCRFGMYNCLQRQILRHSGRSAPIIAPTQDSTFSQQFARARGVSGISMMKDLWKSTIAIDLLQKVLLRIRPYAVEPELMNALYRDILNEWCRLVEQRPSLARAEKFMTEAALRLAAVPLDRSRAKPRIGIVGEIYVRNHPFSNSFLIERLEALGAECELAALSEWIYYTNFCARRNASAQHHWLTLLRTCLVDRFEHAIERKLAAPLEQAFGPLIEPRTTEVLDLAAPYIHSSFEGEAVLTVGKAIEMYHQGVNGVINVMPFTCMPSTVVTTQTLRISKECGGLPMLNLVFDGQQDPAMDTRLEAFIDQVRRQQSTPELVHAK
ncbi:MAG: acyl-CoA dehydratase activase [Planctomycetaceae bacterium]|nr:acyl-CoA dehydratase activase [Planctomycetaceae bacterium]